MKTKSKQTACNLFGLRAKKYSIYQTPLVLLFVALFVFGLKASAKESDIVISSILYDPIGADNKSGEESTYESVEIENISNGGVDICKWEIRINSYMSLEKITAPIPPDGKVIILNGEGADSNLDFTHGKEAIIYRNKTGSQLADSKGEVALYNSTTNNENTIIDYVAYGEQFNFNSSTNFKHAESSKIWKEGDAVPLFGEGCYMILGEKKNFGSSDWGSNCEIEDEDGDIEPKKTYVTGINITELFPNPSKSEHEEYVELYNSSGEDINLKDWTLRDASKSGKYTFLESISLKAEEYLAIFKKDFKFALNNSGHESVTLLDPNGQEVAKAIYDGSKKDVSYNFDGSRWRWSKFLTPGKENVLNNEPYGKIKIDDDIFENVYANFSVSMGDADGDKIKVTWDFGDGHKSYLAKTKHKFKKKGKYEGSLKMTDGSEDVSESFSVEVEKIPHPEVRIIAVNANPDGADTGLESLTIENKSKKKINLNGWSIATGWKKFVNHPINEDVEIKKGKEKEITRKVSSFTLNNTKDKIELRYPDGKVAHEVKYRSPNKSIADGEVYRKVKGGWEWVKSHQSSVISNLENTEEISNFSSVISNQPSETKNDEEVIMPEENVEEEVLGVEIEKPKVVVENKLVKINNDEVKIELLKSEPHVLGVETVREVDGIYFFTPQAVEHEHYAIIFFKNISSNINTKLNLLLNYFLN